MGPVSGLEPVAGTPGLLADPAWRPGDPGTFALIIGVSRYDHLDGGPDPAPDTYTLGQLYVSAATGYRLFLWLRDRYSFPQAPPAMCWLLLSPTEKEQTAIGAAAVAAVGAVPATMANCAAAIAAWGAAMEQLPREAATRSRALFFFSGHGLEMNLDRQILLPSDYLAPPGFNVNEAISTEFLRKGLASSPVPQQFLFVDACRNDVQRLREMDVEGRRTLNIRSSAHANPDVFAPLLYAAASGTRAYQPQELERGYSLFGGSLVDGLGGADGLELECGEATCEVRVFPLHRYLKGRVDELLAGFGSTERQRVRIGGNPEDLGITMVPRRVPIRGEAPAPLLTAATALEARYTIRQEDLSWSPAASYQEGHELFGSENVTDLWVNLQIRHLHDGTPVAPDDLVVRYVHRSEDTVANVIGFDLPPSPFGHWLQFTDRTGMGFGCALSGDHPVAPTYEIEMDVEPAEGNHQPRPISRLEAGLSPHTNGPTAPVAEAWGNYETHNLAVAVAGIDLGLMSEVLRGKMQSPLSATVAGLLLLRARRLDLLHDTWLRNLSDWFPEHPDGPVLWAEQLAQSAPLATGAAADRITADRTEHLGRLADRGLPRLSEVLAMASGQIDDLTGGDPAAGGPSPERLAAIAAQLKHALRYYRPGGLFAVFAGPPEAIGPRLVMPHGR